MIVILDSIRSLHNVGSIFRTAEGAGIEKIFLCGITPTPTDKFGYKRPQIAKVSLGAEETVAWEYKKSVKILIKKLKNEGYNILALEQNSKSIPINRLRFSKNNLDRIAIILGTEVTGIKQDLLDLVDQIVELPMLGKKESLNVSVAFGIAVYYFILTEHSNYD